MRPEFSQGFQKKASVGKFFKNISGYSRYRKGKIGMSAVFPKYKEGLNEMKTLSEMISRRKDELANRITVLKNIGNKNIKLKKINDAYGDMDANTLGNLSKQKIEAEIKAIRSHAKDTMDAFQPSIDQFSKQRNIKNSGLSQMIGIGSGIVGAASFGTHSIVKKKKEKNESDFYQALR